MFPLLTTREEITLLRQIAERTAIVDKCIDQALYYEALGNEGAANVRWKMAERNLCANDLAQATIAAHKAAVAARSPR